MASKQLYKINKRPKDDIEDKSLDDIQQEFSRKIGHKPHTVKQLLNFCNQNDYGYNFRAINKWWPTRPEPEEKPLQQAVNANNRIQSSLSKLDEEKALTSGDDDYFETKDDSENEDDIEQIPKHNKMNTLQLVQLVIDKNFKKMGVSEDESLNDKQKEQLVWFMKLVEAVEPGPSIKCLRESNWDAQKAMELYFDTETVTVTSVLSHQT